MLRYSREIAFAAAEVYAAAAEARGAWDARLESSVVEALVRDEVGDQTLSRAGSLGWGQPTWITALAAAASQRSTWRRSWTTCAAMPGTAACAS